MVRRSPFVFRALATLLLASPGFADGPADDNSTRYNLIAIVTDDQAQWALGCYGNKQIHTPAMDRLAAEGARFDNAFVATPVCSPSRGTYMTGLWPTQFGITDYLSPEESNAGIGLKAQTWPMVAQRNGYRTALVGKWHLGTQPPFHPTRLGFDAFRGFLEGGTTPMNALLEIDGVRTKTTGPLPDVLTDAAIDWIGQQGDNPFVLCLHFRAPHLPYGPVPDSDRAHYRDLDPTIPNFPGLDGKKVKNQTKGYYASISSVDRNLGRLLDALNKMGLAERTIVCFTSDHGYNEGRHGIDTKGNGQWIAGGQRGPKRPNMWDTSIRVPLLVRWPGVVAPGTQVADYVSNLDMFRTVLGMLNLPLPEELAAGGIDFSPALRGQRLAERPELFGQYDLHNYGLAYMRMIRTPRYKYVRHYRANGMDELYDLQEDPEELDNRIRSDRYQPIVAEMRQRLVAWQKSIADPILD